MGVARGLMRVAALLATAFVSFASLAADKVTLGTDWRAQPWAKVDVAKATPLKAKWSPLQGVVEHAFTHFHLKLAVWVGQSAQVTAAKQSDAIWVSPAQLGKVGLPNVMQKVADFVMSRSPQKTKPLQKRLRTTRGT